MSSRLYLKDLSIYDPPKQSSQPRIDNEAETFPGRLTRSAEKAVEEQVRAVRHFAFPFIHQYLDQARNYTLSVKQTVQKAEHSVAEVGTDTALVARVGAIPAAGLLAALLFLRKGAVARYSAFLAGSGAAGAVMFPDEATKFYGKAADYAHVFWQNTKPSGPDN